MKDPSVIYDAAWFKKDFDHPGVKEDFFLIANALVRQFSPKYVHDYGCGPGMIIERMGALGIFVTGYEGSIHGVAHADESVRRCIEHADLTTLQPSGRTMDHGGLVICTEVAEHIEEQHSAHLVELLCAHMCPIVFTAAPPGQGGHDHCNEKPKEWWLELFAKHGAGLDHDATHELRQRWRAVTVLHHMPKNVMVIR
jgi:2-polyprenyl-3-methyl-5-hydroxy-6-metoxy-1,4-benzoquinol methylase